MKIQVFWLPTPGVFSLNTYYLCEHVLLCAKDQTWINVYKQGMNITKLISEDHIYTSLSVKLSYVFELRFPQFIAVSHLYPSVIGNVL